MDEALHLRLARACRRVAVGLISRAFPGQSLSEVEDRLARQSVGRQVAIVGGVLGCVFAALLVAVQLGWVGLAVFFIAVVLLVG